MRSMRQLLIGSVIVMAAAGLLLAAQQPQVPPRTVTDDGYTDTPVLPGLTWHVHDPARPHPAVVIQGATMGPPPSDATVLVDGRALSTRAHPGHAGTDTLRPPQRTARCGYLETGARTGSL